jgi:hypothetical protein
VFSQGGSYRIALTSTGAIFVWMTLFTRIFRRWEPGTIIAARDEIEIESHGETLFGKRNCRVKLRVDGTPWRCTMTREDFRRLQAWLREEPA